MYDAAIIASESRPDVAFIRNELFPKAETQLGFNMLYIPRDALIASESTCPTIVPIFFSRKKTRPNELTNVAEIKFSR